MRCELATTDVSSTASSGSCDPGHLGAICRIILALTRPAITVSSAGGGLVSGAAHRRICRCPRCRCPDDRHLHCPCASAWSLHYTKPAPIDGEVTRRLDEQNPCGGR